MEIGTLVAFLRADKAEYDAGLDDAGRKLEETAAGADRSSGSMADKIDRNFGRISVAGVAAGGALEAFARQQAPLTEGLGRVSMATGVAEDELRGLAKEASNVTFPLDEAVGLMELGAKQGLESGEALQSYASFWDTVGDATGQSSEELAKAGAGLRAVGIDAGNESEALAAFGYITESTSGNVGDLLKFLERSGPELRDMGLGVNDAAAMMGALETELGMTSRTARTEFREAVNQSDGDLGKMLETLGLSEEQFASYRGAVEESGGTIQGLADNHAETYTWVQKLQHGVEEALFSLGGYGDAAAALALPLLALGPISKGVAGFFRLMGSTALINGAKMAAGWVMAMGPVGWVIAAVVGLVALIIANWDTVVGWTEVAWSAVSGAVGVAVDWLTGKVDSGIATVKGILGWFAGLPGMVGGWFSGAAAAAGGGINRLIGWVAGIPGRALGALGNVGSMLWSSGSALISGFWDGLVARWNQLMGWVRGAMGRLRALWPFSPAKTGPFSGSGYVTHSGKALTGDFAKSIRQGMPNVLSSARDLMDATQGTLSGGVGMSVQDDAAFAEAARRRGGGGDGSPMAVTFNVHNPIAERSSATGARLMQTKAQMGAFSI